MILRAPCFHLPMKKLRTLILLAAALLVGGRLLAACRLMGSSAGTGTFEVDSIFTSFYSLLGGQELLGPAISPIFQYDQLQCQYTENVLLCYNPDVSQLDQFSLYALGGSMNVSDAPITTAPPANERVVDGYIIYADFVPLYDQLYGARYIGRPLTQARPNYDLQRTEQYFEDIGFYHNFDDPPGEVHLLAYGVYACGSGCTYKSTENNLIEPSTNPYLQPFLSALTLMGGVPDFGQPLGDPYTASDGYMEQVYSNVVLSSPPDRPEQAQLRPLAVLLGMPTTPPGPQVYDESNGVVFVKVQGSLGYHVPLVFKDFIDRHGGFSISGNPISDTLDLGNGTYRQCFTNYCLDYITNTGGANQVRMVALGEQYVKFTGTGGGNPQFVFSTDTVTIQATAAQPRIAVDATEEIDLVVIGKADGKPISNVEAVLVVTYPDGTQYTAHFAPTAADGTSTALIPPNVNLANGTLIPYQVCLNVPSTTPLCTSGSYLIWNE
jgi:hypothetical protein